jgi:transposase-like protein
VTGERCRFRSSILPPWARKSPKVAEVLRGLKRRGMTGPALAVGNGALGFWGALGEVFPDTVHQRCWVHYVDWRIMWTAERKPRQWRRAA